MLIADDPIIRSIESTGYPPWNRGYDPGYCDDEDETEDGPYVYDLWDD